MSDLVPVGSTVANELVHQSQLLAQLMQSTVRATQALQEDLQLHKQNTDKALAHLNSKVQVLEAGYKLITANMLDTMLGANWTEREKNDVGGALSKFCRARYVKPTKVPHPTIPGGVNGYPPGLVKAWIEEETEYLVPDELRYVD